MIKINRVIQIVISFLILISCNKDAVNDSIPDNANQDFITAVDISSYPEIASTNSKFYDLNESQKDFLKMLEENRINRVRLRLWRNPINKHFGFNEVKQASQILKANCFKIWLTLYYSNTWKDSALCCPPKNIQ